MTESPLALFEYEWGWNDPPPMSYQDHSSATGKKPPSVLQQRVPYPVATEPESNATGKQQGEPRVAHSLVYTHRHAKMCSTIVLCS